VGDFNGDGVPDLFGIKVSSAASGRVEVHVLDGASGYQQFLLQKPTNVNQGEAQKLRMVVAPLNQGGIADVFALQVQGAPSGKLRFRVLDDLDDFQTPALEVGTPIDAADAAANFSWAVGDLDGDGVADLIGIKTSGSGSGTVEVHVLGGVGAARIPTSRVFPAGDPFGYAAQVPRVVYRGDDGHVYELAIYPETGGWGLFDMSGATGAPSAAGDPMGYLSNTARVVYRTGDGHVHEIWLGGNGWEHFDMTAATGAPPAAGDPFGYYAQVPRVVYRGTDGHVWELAIYPETGSWGAFDMTAATGASSIAGDPFGYMTQVPRVVYRGTNGHVYELAIYPETGGWGAFDMTAATGAPVAAGDPMGYQSNTARVVYRGGDGHVHEIWLGSNGWEHFDMTDATKAPAPAGNPMGYHLDTPRVVYRSGIRPVFELAIDGGSWRRLEL
jgi:hypothetical protein